MAGTYLITGGAGNLACQLTFELADTSSHIVLFDIAKQPVMRPSTRCSYVQGDVTHGQTVEAVMNEYRPDVVIHFASILSGGSEENRRLAWQVNMDGSFHLFEQAIRFGVQRFFFASSIATYGGKLPLPISNDQAQWPESLYGVTKVAVERLGWYYHSRHGLDFRGLRIPIVVSPQAHTGAASAFASLAFIQAVSEGRYEFRVRPTSRPALIYVKDVLQAIVQLLEASPERVTQRVYNINALSPTAEELSQAIIARLPDTEITFRVDIPTADLIDSWPIEFDDTSARRDWNWRAKYELEAMADDFIELLRNEP